MTDGWILFQSGLRGCALPLRLVRATMRPLPVLSLPGAPPFVRGTALIRGAATPVVDVRVLLGDDAPGPAERCILVHTHDTHHVGLLVDEVLGLRTRDSIVVESLSPLVGDIASSFIQSLARLDDRLLTVLRVGSIVPQAVWARLLGGETT